jgi:hypothetical protein
VRSFVTSGRQKSIRFSIALSSSHSNLPNKYRTSTGRLPCEKTIQRRKVDLSRFTLSTMEYWINGPRNEVKTSDRVETSRKLSEGGLRFITLSQVCNPPR